MPTNDAFVQVALDGSGKKMETALVRQQSADATTGAPTEVHRQRAEIVGQAGDALDQLLAMNKMQVQLLQAILSNLNATSNVNPQPEDFPLDT